MASLRMYILYIASVCANFKRNHIPWLWAICDFISLCLVDLARLFAGHNVAEGALRSQRPQKPLELYEFEGCPFCRRVRETLTVLDIDYICYPCPRETLRKSGACTNSRYRPVVAKDGGKLQFPYLVDPNTNEKLYESGSIEKYLWEKYGDQATPAWNYTFVRHPFIQKISFFLCALARPCVDMGMLRAPSHAAKERLELWGSESSPFVRRVRETLTTLEIPHLYHTMATGSLRKREAFKQAQQEKLSSWRRKAGMCKIPFIIDPNTNAEMFESSAIVEYLKRQYQTSPVPRESWLEYGVLDKPKNE